MNSIATEHRVRMAKKISTLFYIGMALAVGLSASLDAHANERDIYKRIYDRLAGVPPTPAEMDAIMAVPLANRKDETANRALAHPAFYKVTLKNFATPWTNEAQSVFFPLNDYSATVIGIIRDDLDYRRVLYDDIIYTGSVITDYSHSNNTLYENLENNNANLADTGVLVKRTQSELPGGLAFGATAGIMTTRAAARAYFVDGTNRAMFRFTMLNHLCYDMEQLKDNTRTADRIRQDVSRSPGGDSRIFFNNCLACHAGMDPMAQAFAYYEWSYKDIDPENPDVGRLVYTPGVVQPKYHINENNFKGGYVTPDDRWSNYWRRGPNAWLGWENNDPPKVIEGNGAKSLGMELAHSDAFARCQVKKVFQTVCLRTPDNTDQTQVNSLVSAFKGSGNMKTLFKDTAIYCAQP